MLLKEIKLAAGAVRAGLGDRPVRMKLTCGFVITTTITSGVTNTVTIGGISNSLNPSNCTEWNTCAALFEEARCFGGEVEFVYLNPVNSDGKTSLIENNIPTIAYDADDNTAATSSLALTQASQHRTIDVWGVMGTGSFPANTMNPMMHRFRWHVPKGVVSPNTSNTSQPGTEWFPIAAVPGMGWLKFYHVGSLATAINSGVGRIYFDLEFRCRS